MYIIRGKENPKVLDVIIHETKDRREEQTV